MCYSENYVENTAKQVNSCNIDWMNCVTVNIMGSYWTAGGQRYCSLNVVWYSEQYVEGIAQQVDSGFVTWN